MASTYSNVYGGRSPKMLDPRDVDANVERDFTEGFLPYQADLQERLENDASLRDIATYSQGAYSFMALGSSPRDRDAQREAMTGSMFWAGEASNTNYAATAHGAIASGWAAGEQALKNLGVDVTVKPVSVPAPTAAPILITTPEGEVTIAPPPCPAGSYANFDWDELPDCSKDIANQKSWLQKGLVE